MSTATEQAHPPFESRVHPRFCHKCAQLGHTSRQCLTFKTRPCKYFYQGRCNKPPHVCVYAHGDTELRPSSLNWCTRIIYENGRRTIEGCCNPGHTIEHCQLQQTSGVWVPPASTPLPPVDTQQPDILQTDT